MVCHVPERLNKRRWVDLDLDELACEPHVLIPQQEVPIPIAGNTSMSCGATGDPLPTVNWILDGRLLDNRTETDIEEGRLISKKVS